MIWLIQKLIFHYFLPNFWFHGSSVTHRKSIKDNGLIINPNKKTYDGLSKDGAIYLTKSLWSALYYSSKLHSEIWVDVYLVKVPYSSVEVQLNDTIDEAIVRQNVKTIIRITMPSFLGVCISMLEFPFFTKLLLVFYGHLYVYIWLLCYVIGLVLVDFIPNSWFYKKPSKINVDSIQA